METWSSCNTWLSPKGSFSTCVVPSCSLCRVSKHTTTSKSEKCSTKSVRLEKVITGLVNWSWCDVVSQTQKASSTSIKRSSICFVVMWIALIDCKSFWVSAVALLLAYFTGIWFDMTSFDVYVTSASFSTSVLNWRQVATHDSSQLITKLLLINSFSLFLKNQLHQFGSKRITNSFLVKPIDKMCLNLRPSGAATVLL